MLASSYRSYCSSVALEYGTVGGTQQTKAIVPVATSYALERHGTLKYSRTGFVLVGGNGTVRNSSP